MERTRAMPSSEQAAVPDRVRARTLFAELATLRSDYAGGEVLR